MEKKLDRIENFIKIKLRVSIQLVKQIYLINDRLNFRILILKLRSKFGKTTA